MIAAETLARRAPAALAGVVALALILVLLTGRSGDIDGVADESVVIASAQLHFEDGPAGSVEVYATDREEILQRFSAGEGSFVRGVLRSMTRERRSWEVGSEQPFVLSRHSDGALILKDETTGRLMVLNAFGATNAGIFDQLLDAASRRS